jgi:antitoxin FitA
MPKTVQIRNLDDRAYTVLRTRAAAENLSLTAYLKRELESFASRPTMAEWLDRIDRRRPEDGPTTEEIVEAVHEARQEREDQLAELWTPKS